MTYTRKGIRNKATDRGEPEANVIHAIPVAPTGTPKSSRNDRKSSTGKSSKLLGEFPIRMLLVFVATLFCLAAPVVAAGIAYLSIQYSTRILANTSTLGVSIGDKTVNEAAELIHQAGNLSHSIEVSNQFLSQQIPINELGISIDALKTAEIAYLQGRDGDLFSKIQAILQAYTGGIVIKPMIVVDENQARSCLEARSNDFSLDPVEAAFYLDNNLVKASPGAIGYTPNLKEALLSIRGNPEGLFYTNQFILPLKPVLPNSMDLTSLVGEARRLVEQPVELILYDPILDQWMTEPVPTPVLLEWLTISPIEGAGSLKIQPERVADFLASFNQRLLPERSIDIEVATTSVIEIIASQSHPVIIIHHHPTRYMVQPGDTLLRIGWKLGFPYWQIVNANPSIDPDRLAPGTEIDIPSKEALLPLPVVLHKRIIISIEQQHLWVYEYGKQIQNFVISTGIDRSPTQPGIFQVQTHVRSAYASIWDLTMPHFLGIYEAWPGFMNGIHGLPTLSNGRLLWSNILGKPASYGCIILNLNAAEWLYQWAEDGVVVEIRP